MTAPVNTLAVWGKADRDQVHPVLFHAHDTAAVARRVFGLFLGPRVRDELLAGFEPLGDPIGWIAWLAGLHDIGKASPTFQGLRADLATVRLGEVAASDVHRIGRQRVGKWHIDTPHGLITAIHVRDLLSSWGIDDGAAERISAALGGHHGHIPDGSLLRQARREVNNHGGQGWRETRDEIAIELARLRGLPDPATQPWHDVHISDPAALCLAALTTLSDWIASDARDNFPLTDMDDVSAYVALSEQRAEAAVARLDLRPWTPPGEFRALFPGEIPRPVQEVVERLTTGREEPTLLLIEAPTGEGKSHAGLQAAAALVRDLGLLGVYVAMPTQATSNQMLGELADLAAGVRVNLVHGNAREYLRDRVTTPAGVGEDAPGNLDVVAQEWFTRKRSLLASLGVGTVDQVLKGAIRSDHVFLSLAALTNKVVVIDEIHGYETYMSTLLDRLLTWLGRLGVSVVMLSATLPSARRQELVASWQAGILRCLPRETPRIEHSAAYPAVTLADSGRPRIVPAGVSDLNDNRVLALQPVADEEIVDWLLTRARTGAVAVMHNLVRRAVSTHAALERRIAELPGPDRPELVMINGQLPAGERAEVEKWLRETVGRNGKRPRSAIVVGTQVLEQGLDLDFDAVLTDLAPVDWMIQRAGRLHRHRRDAERGTPTLGITGVVNHNDGPPTFPAYAGLVYAPAILLRTWAVLRDRATLSLPAEVRGLVDSVYGPAEAIACPTGWEPAWAHTAAALSRTQDRSDRDARVHYLPLPNALIHLSELTKHSRNPSQTREYRGKR